ncbi:MAG: flippase [Deltaproteobacteria bacterium]|nr:flippase [Deltaproteobacteria bacterium]
MKLIDKLLTKLNLSPNRRKVVKNVYWAVLGKIVHIISGLLVGILVARYLGPDKFGLMNYVISYVTLFSVFAAFGLNNIEIRELSKHNAAKETILGTAFAIRLVFAVAAILLILVTLILFESDAFTFTMVMVYSLSLILSALNVIRNYFTSIVLNEYVVKTEISRTIIGSGIKVFLLLNHCSLAWFIAASTFDFVLIGGGYLYSYRKKEGSICAWTFDFTVARMLIRESFPILLSGTAVIIYQKIDAVMIRNMMDNASVGQFSVASKITELAIFIPIVIAQTVTPLLVKAHQEDPARYHAKRQQFMDIMVWSAMAMAVGMSLLAAPAIRILYGEKYLAAIPVLQIMAWKAVFMALFSASGQMILIENIQRFVAVRNVIGCIVSVALNYLLIPIWGIIGSAVATVMTMAFSGYFSHFFIKPYRHLVPIQTKALLFGWKRLLHPSLLRK